MIVEMLWGILPLLPLRLVAPQPQWWEILGDFLPPHNVKEPEAPEVQEWKVRISVGHAREGGQSVPQYQRHAEKI